MKRLPSFALVAVFGCGLCMNAAHAAIGTWTGVGPQTWDTTATNWSGVAGTPWDSVNGPTNDATLDNGGTAIVFGGTVTTNVILLNGGNTLNVSAGSAQISMIGGAGNEADMIIGDTVGGNSVVISSPGTSGSPTVGLSGNGNNVDVGRSSSNNSLTVQGGGYLRVVSSGGGTNTWNIGLNAGANNNTILVTGTGSTIDRGGAAGSSINVGVAGNSNSMTISNGGTVIPRRLGIGTNGGDDNFVRVTGTGSFLSGNDSQPILEIGRQGGTGNYLQIDSGATATFNSNGVRGYMVGADNGSDNNYILVDGVGSTFTLRQNQPLAIGGIAGQNNNNNIIIDSTAAGNHFDIHSGAQSFQNTVYLLGTNSAVNLGNGTGISELEVRHSNGSLLYPGGVFLSKADSTLNINEGRLTAGATGGTSTILVSGPGQMNLLGNAYINQNDTVFNRTISSQITGTGHFIKEGGGELILTSALNNYTGNTSITAGVLEIQNATLADAADVLLTSGATFDLNFAGTDTINALLFDGLPQAVGTWGSSASGAANINDLFFSGTGQLLVQSLTPAGGGGGGGGGGEVPEPASILLWGIVAAALAGYCKRRRRKK